MLHGAWETPGCFSERCSRWGGVYRVHSISETHLKRQVFWEDAFKKWFHEILEWGKMVEWKGSCHGCLRAASSHARVPVGEPVPPRAEWYPWSELWLETMLMSVIRAMAWNHVNVHDLCCSFLIWARKVFVFVFFCSGINDSESQVEWETLMVSETTALLCLHKKEAV